jgi:sporulation protein YlmC with PRC-barrel domain
MAQMTSTRSQPISIGHLLNEHVTDIEGRDIGKVEDLVLDYASGSIDFAVVKFGGFLGMGGKYHVIPWELVNIDTERRAFTMDVSKEQVDRAPAFDSNNVPDVEDTEYMDAVFGYWGVQRGGGSSEYGESSRGTGYSRTSSGTGYGETGSGTGYAESGSGKRYEESGSDTGYTESGRSEYEKKSSRDVNYGDGTTGPERREGSVHGGDWNGSERRAGW